MLFKGSVGFPAHIDPSTHSENPTNPLNTHARTHFDLLLVYTHTHTRGGNATLHPVIPPLEET